MEWLNYHHLHYFWTVAREGGVARAGAKLRLSQPTISAQVRLLERRLGERLLQRKGRGLELTEIGRVVFRYADEIFGLGRELLDTVHGRPTGRPLRLEVGIAEAVPKLVARRLLEPALHLPEPLRMVCREDKPDRLLADLALHQLDVVLSDAPVPPGSGVRAFNHLLGECGIAFFAAPRLADKLAARPEARFPRVLDGAPFLLPAENSALRRALEAWFDAENLRPAAAVEFDDSALMKVFGQHGAGVFAAPRVIAAEIRRQYRVHQLGQTEAVRERFYAISYERRVKHPAVLAIRDAARTLRFG